MADFRVQGRATQGVRIINLDKRGDSIASVCCVDSEEEVEEIIDGLPENTPSDNSISDSAAQEPENDETIN